MKTFGTLQVYCLSWVILLSPIICTTAHLIEPPPATNFELDEACPCDCGPYQHNELNELGCNKYVELFHNETQKCYHRNSDPINGDGPCGVGMTLTEPEMEPNHGPGFTPSKYGVCRCTSIVQLCQGRPTIFWKPENRCYNAYDQGPCKSDEWIVYSDKWEPECRKTSCPNPPTSKPANSSEAQLQFNQQKTVASFNFTYNGVCYETGTQAFCREDTKAYFVGTLDIPQCFPLSTPPPTSCLAFASSPQFGGGGIGNTAHRPSMNCGPKESLRDGQCIKHVTFES